MLTFLYRIYCVIRLFFKGLTFFLHSFLDFFPQTWPFFTRRWQLEKEWERRRIKNKNEVVASSAFDLSSEGELEQILPLVRYLSSLEAEGKMPLELIFSSESVAKKMLKLQEGHSNLNISLYPYLTSWRGAESQVRAQNLLLCRYNFFPEWVLWKAHRRGHLVLLWASFKNKGNSFLTRFLWRLVYGQFDLIVCANALEQQRFQALGLPSERLAIMDFRIPQILWRQKDAKQSMAKAFGLPLNQAILSLFNTRSEHEKRPLSLLMGSCYAEEMSIFQDLQLISAMAQKKLMVVLAPHSLQADSVERLKQRLEQVLFGHSVRVPIVIINKECNPQDIISSLRQTAGAIYISVVPGILCEFYTLFDIAYVGGGFHRSIHSVLEPYCAGTQVICGAKTHRSTEYDMIKNNSPQFVTRVEQLSEIPRIVLQALDQHNNSEDAMTAELKKRAEWFQFFESEAPLLMKKIAEKILQ